MKGFMKSIALLIIFSQATFAQDVITVEAKRIDVSDNLDLEAVASVFGESENLEDFENRLNDPERQICNLDLNEDGYVDYLRVVENSEEQTILITIQAVLGKDLFQDVATIDVEKDNYGETQVQVVGDVYMYGSDYIIEPVYIHTPVVCSYFWDPYYHSYHSPYYWHYYPSYYHAWHPLLSHVYRHNVYTHVNVHHAYNYTSVRRSARAMQVHSSIRRNDYGRANPNKSFSVRNTGVKNTHELNRQRGTVRATTSTRSSNTRTVAPRSTTSTRSSNTRTVAPRSTTSTNSTKRKVQSDWKSTSRPNNRSGQVKSNRTSTNRTTTARPSQNKKSYNRSTQSKSSNNRSTQSRSSQNRNSQVKSGKSSSSNKQGASRSGGQKSNNNKSGSSRSGSSKGRSKGK
ncbi:MAG: hypothetical protein GQ564_01405 [Bacteroidales bacterium]|nr:hypothetical protein [Bacteroidales bacterium]